jgi:hypothetical protein
MATDKKTEAYAALAEAESAVAAVKDPELRRVAFEKILATLIEQNITADGAPGRQASRGQAAVPGTKSKAKPNVPKTQSGPKAHIEELIAEDFFAEQRTIAGVKAELANRGRHIALTSLSGPLQKLTQERRLRRQKTSTNGKRQKGTYAYSNW